MLISTLPVEDQCCFEYLINNLPIEFKDKPIVKKELVQLSDTCSYFINPNISNIDKIVTNCLVVTDVTDIEEILTIYNRFFIVDQKFFNTNEWCNSNNATNTCLSLEVLSC